MKILKLTIIFIFFTNIVQSVSQINDPIELSTQYIGEIASVISGGKEKGTMIQGKGSLFLNLETSKLGLWNGGKLFVNGTFTHGGNFSETKVGDYQVVSNIDAGSLTYIHELWFLQKLWDFEIKLGVIDLNSDYLVSNSGSNFLNSSFGVPSVIAFGLPAPIYPLTAMGVSASWEISKMFTFKTSIFDGLPTSFENNPHNTNWHINDKDGFQFFNEFELKTNLIEGLNTSTKVGYYYHTGIKDIDNPHYNAYTTKSGYYAVIDQELFKFDQRIFNYFIQATYCPTGNLNHNNVYIGSGVVVENIINIPFNNTFGVAIALSEFNNKDLDNEIALEIFGKIQLCKSLFVQPDMQYIINPMGDPSNKVKNALIGFLRLHFSY